MSGIFTDHQCRGFFPSALQQIIDPKSAGKNPCLANYLLKKTLFWPTIVLDKKFKHIFLNSWRDDK